MGVERDGDGAAGVGTMTNRQLVKLAKRHRLTRLELRMAQILLRVNGADSAEQYVTDVAQRVQPSLPLFGT